MDEPSSKKKRVEIKVSLPILFLTKSIQYFLPAVYMI